MRTGSDPRIAAVRSHFCRQTDTVASVVQKTLLGAGGTINRAAASETARGPLGEVGHAPDCSAEHGENRIYPRTPRTTTITITMVSFPALEPFLVDGPPSVTAAKWKLWVERLENYFAAMAIDQDRKRPMFLHLGGREIHKISKSVVEEDPPFSYQTLKRAITAYFERLANPDYECFLLRKARQLPEELVDAF
ncbi:hypothetical protein NDU88_003289 [Pleurodeles waltl]|uniref:Uncharacterized protein n=1 Tax=Pleurodeles waltl TaxID=8319 RepID=A0AAV7MAM0_PLEWA|nr:hypothetical protein NDU88_003289 [Pleurodeles waltl]